MSIHVQDYVTKNHDETHHYIIMLIQDMEFEAIFKKDKSTWEWHGDSKNKSTAEHAKMLNTTEFQLEQLINETIGIKETV
jgi:hypothetical protein